MQQAFAENSSFWIPALRPSTWIFTCNLPWGLTRNFRLLHECQTSKQLVVVNHSFLKFATKEGSLIFSLAFRFFYLKIPPSSSLLSLGFSETVFPTYHSSLALSCNFAVTQLEEQLTRRRGEQSRKLLGNISLPLWRWMACERRIKRPDGPIRNTDKYLQLQRGFVIEKHLNVILTVNKCAFWQIALQRPRFLANNLEDKHEKGLVFCLRLDTEKFEHKFSAHTWSLQSVTARTRGLNCFSQHSIGVGKNPRCLEERTLRESSFWKRLDEANSTCEPVPSDKWIVHDWRRFIRLASQVEENISGNSFWERLLCFSGFFLVVVQGFLVLGKGGMTCVAGIKLLRCPFDCNLSKTAPDVCDERTARNKRYICVSGQLIFCSGWTIVVANTRDTCFRFFCVCKEFSSDSPR